MSQKNNDLIKTINEVIKEFKVAMLVTIGDSKNLYARPMSITKHNNETGDIFFTTNIESAKTAELEKNPRVSVTMQSKSQLVSLSGQATVIMIKCLFNNAWGAWYSESPEEDNIRLIHFTPDRGEYWDMSGLKSLEFLWNAGKATAIDQALKYEETETHASL